MTLHCSMLWRSMLKQSQTIKYAMCSKYSWQETNFRNSEHTMQNHTKCCFLIQTLCGVFLGELEKNNTLTAPMPAWKNMPMMAIIASLPFAISALSFLVFSAGSAAVNTLNPKSPAYASVPGVCSWETSQKAM